MASDIQTNISGKDAPHAEAPLGEVILRTQGLTKHYGGVHALVDCDFEIRKGDFNALVEVLQQAMDAQGIAFTAQNRLLARLAPMHRDIINKP